MYVYNKMKITIALNQNKPIAIDFLDIVIAVCQKYNIDYCFAQDYKGIDTQNRVDTNADLLVTIGGDGTILYAVKHIDLPVLGINLGRVGFLTEVQATEIEIEDALKTVLNGNFTYKNRTMLSAQIDDNEFEALNDMVLFREGCRLVDMDIDIGNAKLGRVRADGLIICTNTGSTAYNLVAGGSVMSNDAQVIGLTPLGAQSLASRPLVIGDNNIIYIKTISTENIRLECDGITVATIAPNCQVIIKKSKRQIKFVRLKQGNFYKKLNSKLGIWSNS